MSFISIATPQLTTLSAPQALIFTAQFCAYFAERQIIAPNAASDTIAALWNQPEQWLPQLAQHPQEAPAITLHRLHFSQVANWLPKGPLKQTLRRIVPRDGNDSKLEAVRHYHKEISPVLLEGLRLLSGQPDSWNRIAELGTQLSEILYLDDAVKRVIKLLDVGIAFHESALLTGAKLIFNLANTHMRVIEKPDAQLYVQARTAAALVDVAQEDLALLHYFMALEQTLALSDADLRYNNLSSLGRHFPDFNALDLEAALLNPLLAQQHNMTAEADRAEHIVSLGIWLGCLATEPDPAHYFNQLFQAARQLPSSHHRQGTQMALNLARQQRRASTEDSTIQP